MAAARHRREKRRTLRPLLRRAAGPAALVAITSGVLVAGHGLSGAVPPTSRTLDLSAGAGAAASPVPSQVSRERLRAVSRSSSRIVVAKPVTLRPRTVGHRYATANLNVWTLPREQGARVGLIPAGSRLAVTGQTTGHWAEVLLKDQRVRWVNDTYLALKKPVAGSAGGSAATSGVSSAPCPDGSATESGLTSSAVRLYRAVCAAFPALTTYGGYDAHGEHASGRAIDFMISDPALGQAVATWVQAHASELDIYDVIWQQHIWTPVRASEGWRFMPDRGSPTANHYDHVHVSVN
jgi:hypothetical protein